MRRSAAWGQAPAQRPHCTHAAGFHTGTSAATPRFSHCVVATGHTPSTGIFETGSSSPFWAIIFAVTSRTNSGAAGSTVGGRGGRSLTASGSGGRPVAASGTGTLWMPSAAASMQAMFLRTTVSPLDAYVSSAAAFR